VACLLRARRLCVQLAETQVASRHERPHLEFLSQGDRLTEVGLRALEGRRIERRRNIPEEAESMR
jgi:hypothetical protein